MKKSNRYLLFFVFVAGIFITLNKPAQANEYFNPHGNYQISTLGCAVCHSAHASTWSPLLSQTLVKRLCYYCHDGSNSNYDVKSEFGELNEGESSHFSYHPVPDGDMTCADCHNPHLTPEDAPGILSVGESGTSSGNAVCAECHREDSGLPGSDITTYITGTSHDTMLSGPSSGTEIKCIRCHQPHGSPYSSLLRESIHDENQVLRTVSGNNNTVCFGCHTSGVRNYNGESIFSQSKHGSPPDPSLNAISVYPGSSYLPGMCLNCHEPHGRSGFSKYTRVEGNGLCVKCHDDASINLPINYSYRGIEDYNTTSHAIIVGPRLYTAGSADFAVWEQVHEVGFEMQTPSNTGQLVTQGGVANLLELNSAYLSTGLAVNQDDYNTQMFKFKVEESLESITKFRAKWVGYGEPTVEPVHPTKLFIWNLTSNSWELLNSEQIATEKTVEFLKENVTDYISLQGEVYLLAAAKHDGTAPVISNLKEEQTNYDGVAYTVKVSWDTNEFAKSWLEYGPTTDYGTTLSDNQLRKKQAIVISELPTGVVHYRVWSEDALGNQSAPVNGTFELRAPSASPVLISATLINPDPCMPYVDASFNWSPITAEEDEYGVKYNVQYQIQVSRNSGFTDIYNESQWLSEQFNANGTQKTQTMILRFENTGTYYWRVKARYQPYPVSFSASNYNEFPVSWCPVLYTWDGEKYTFVNYLRGGNLGREMTQGKYLEYSPNEQLVIPGSLLVEKDGFYTIKIKNELNEIDYIDNLQLQAVDHPVGTEIALKDFAGFNVVDLELMEAILEYGGIAEQDLVVQHEGKFTRYGDVLPLLQEIDDRLVVMDTGDELTVSFKALSPLQPGMLRSFVIKPWAYYKEGDVTVEPMPFMGMDLSRYPGFLGEYPEQLNEYVMEWNSRIHVKTEDDADSKGLLHLVFKRVLNWFQGLRDVLSQLAAGKGNLKTARVEFGSIEGAMPAESFNQLHYSLNTNYIELEIVSTESDNIGNCANCHAVHGKSGAPKQLKDTKSFTCFGNDFGCHSDPSNSATGSMSSANFTSGAGATSRHSIDPQEQAAFGTKVECTNCHNPHLNNAVNKTVNPDNTTALLNQWIDNGIGDYIDEDGSVYLLAQAKHDGSPPSITQISTTVNSDVYRATVSWHTNEVATRQLEWIVTPKNYEQTVPDAVYNYVYTAGNSVDFFSSPHTMYITGMEYDKDYHFRIQAIDRVGNLAYSSDPTFDELTRLVHTLATPTNLRHSIHPYPEPGKDILRFEWDAVTDLDGYGVQYYVQVNTYSTTSGTMYSEWIDQPYWDIVVPETPEVRYTWRVKARNPYTSSPYSVWDQFYNGYSCPVLYTWNGEKYTFVTDIVGGNFGLEIAPGRYSIPSPGDQLVIPGSMLNEQDGFYRLKIKNELDEIDYIDNLVLQVVDHPVGTKIALNDFVRRTEPYKIYTYNEDVRPVKKATYFNNPTYSGGDPSEPVDITELISKIDNRHAIGKMGDDNHFIFDLGDVKGAETIKLVVVGWNEFANLPEREERLEKAKEGIRMAPRLLEVLQPDGTWTSEEIKQIPGHTKTIVIDLSSKFAEDTDDYIVRLRGMYRPHFDFVGVDTSPQQAIKTTDLELIEATLEYGGLVERTLYPSPYYDYYKPTDFKIQHEGKFTRYGDVLPLLQEINDKLVVMDSGDELSVAFKAIPPPEPGMIRSYVLKPWVYYKETFTATVDPMPFRGLEMSKYPDGFEYPEELQEYIEEWNTRVHSLELTDSVESKGQTLISRLIEFLKKILQWFKGLFGREVSEEEAGKNIKKFKPVSSRGEAYPEHYSLNTEFAGVSVGTATGNNDYLPVSVWQSDFEPTPVNIPESTLSTSPPWSTDLAVADGHNYQLFKFSIQEPKSALEKLSARWVGYGEPTPGYNTTVYIRNFQTGMWEVLANGNYYTPTVVNFFVNKENSDYCNKCHDNQNLPDGVLMGQPLPANIDTSVKFDKHGIKPGSKSSVLHSPYVRGTRKALACDDCHDPHGSSNIYHIRETVNFNEGISVTSSSGLDAKVLCQSCHPGSVNAWHSTCIDTCHDGASDHEGLIPLLQESGNLKNCFNCHGHNEKFTDDKIGSGCHDCHDHVGASLW